MVNDSRTRILVAGYRQVVITDPQALSAIAGSHAT